jgi:hypothetical protein
LPQTKQVHNYVSSKADEGHALSSMLLNFASEYAIRETKETRKTLQQLQTLLSFLLYGMHQLLVYADDINLFDKNVSTIKRYTGSITSQEEGWSRRENMFMSRHWNVRKYHNINKDS